MDEAELDVFSLNLKPPHLQTFAENIDQSKFVETHTLKLSKIETRPFVRELRAESTPQLQSTLLNQVHDETYVPIFPLYKSPPSPTKTIGTIINDEIPTDIDQIIKILIVGNAKCGKSSIIQQYASKMFDNSYKTTIGADFVRKDVMIKLNSGTKIGIRLQLWDIAGQDRFQKLTRAYFNKARGVIVVCDVSREGTVDAVKSWKKEVDSFADQMNVKNMPVILFANKADLLTNPQDALKTGAIMEKVCREQKFIDWIITSARNGDCIEEGFNMLMLNILERDAINNKISDNVDSLTSNNSFKLGSIDVKQNSHKGLGIENDCC